MKVYEYNNRHNAHHVNAWIIGGDGLDVTHWWHNKDLGYK